MILDFNVRSVVYASIQQADIDSLTQKISELINESVVVDNAEKCDTVFELVVNFAVHGKKWVADSSRIAL